MGNCIRVKTNHTSAVMTGFLFEYGDKIYETLEEQKLGKAFGELKSVQALFNFAVKHKLFDLVEYMYINNKIKYNKKTLFEYALHHGIHDIVVDLYVNEGIVYDLHLI